MFKSLSEYIWIALFIKKILPSQFLCGALFL